jgi:hypothetical protein
LLLENVEWQAVRAGDAAVFVHHVYEGFQLVALVSCIKA